MVSTFALPSDNRRLAVSPAKRVKTTLLWKVNINSKLLRVARIWVELIIWNWKGRKKKMIKRSVKMVNGYSLFWVRGRCRSLVLKFFFLKLFYFRVICYFSIFYELNSLKSRVILAITLESYFGDNSWEWSQMDEFVRIILLNLNEIWHFHSIQIFLLIFFIKIDNKLRCATKIITTSKKIITTSRPKK